MTDIEQQLDRFRRRAAGEGLIDVSYEAHDTPVGELLVCTTDAGLVALALPEDDVDVLLQRLSARVSPRVLRSQNETITTVRRALDDYFRTGHGDFTLPLDWRLASTFQRDVLVALAGVRSGSTVSYTQLAERAGRPAAVRATGTVLARNPIPIVVPCHRVLQRGGAIGSYRGGPQMKRTLLELEGAL